MDHLVRLLDKGSPLSKELIRQNLKRFKKSFINEIDKIIVEVGKRDTKRRRKIKRRTTRMRNTRRPRRRK